LGKLNVARRAFSSKQDSAEALIQRILEVSRLAKRQGLLTEESRGWEENFLGQGMKLLAEGYDIEVARAMLVSDMQQSINRLNLRAKTY
jgi:chemotaxis protein MotA